jgi:D-3-phosphoglycerate dehydrogenase
LEKVDRLLIVARFGVGYDSVDVQACTDHGVLLTITPDGVRRPVAASAIALLLALSHKMLIKDRLTREGRWHEKLDHFGTGTTGRTLGLIGFGNIGREIARLIQPFEMQVVASDPFAMPTDASALGVKLLDLPQLLAQADFAIVCCSLSKETRHLIGAQEISRMKPTAYLINVARGPIIDQIALTEALQKRTIQGAGLDVFEQEPIPSDDPLLKLDNVIVAPHAICWTDECFLNIGRSACTSIVNVAQGRVPKYIVNSDALKHKRLRDRLKH